MEREQEILRNVLEALLPGPVADGTFFVSPKKVPQKKANGNRCTARLPWSKAQHLFFGGEQL
jgi:hypothetical protein